MKKLLILFMVLFCAFTKAQELTYTYNAEVVRVYDGDTCTLDIDLGFNITLHDISVRVYGIDTPERSRVSALEKQAGKLVTTYVDSLLYSTPDIVTETFKGSDDKYGRYLAKIFYGGTHLSDHLLERKFAKEYHGGRKEKWTVEDLEYIIKALE